MAVPVSDHPLVNTSNHVDRVGHQTLKGRYLQYLHERADNAVCLRGVVKNLLDEGVPRRTLVAWGGAKPATEKDM